MKFARILDNKLDRSQLFDAEQNDGALYLAVPEEMDLSVMRWTGSALVEDPVMVLDRDTGNPIDLKIRQDQADA